MQYTLRMNKMFMHLLLLFVLISCKNNKPQELQNNDLQLEYSVIIKEDYELHMPAKQAKAVLILFGDYPESIEDIKREFNILETTKIKNIAVLFLNYNKKLWLEENEKHQLANQLQEIFEKNQLPTNNIYIGGFSSGGVISLSISDYILGMKKFYIDPKGIFIVDSPIDLVALYTSSEKNIKQNFSEVSVQESNWIIENLGNTLGNPKDDIKKYESKSVFTFKTNNTSNLQHLKNTKIRLYTEPDTLWWKKNRMADYDQTNAFCIKKVAERLKEEGFEKVQYITTTNKGYRANGNRHPHSWSIVDKNDLVNWMLTN